VKLIKRISVIARGLNHKLNVKESSDGGIDIIHSDYGLVTTLYKDDVGNEKTYIREALEQLSENFGN
jgi:hypothetical protein